MSRILPTPLVFISGYANTENVFYCLNVEIKTRTCETHSTEFTVLFFSLNMQILPLNVSVCFGYFHKWRRKFCYSLVLTLIRPVLLTLLWFEFSFEFCLLVRVKTKEY